MPRTSLAGRLKAANRIDSRSDRVAPTSRGSNLLDHLGQRLRLPCWPVTIKIVLLEGRTKPAVS
ncbi:hypothetical protein M413DRAFT_245237 [Hebeloma cylindrosporum]|uniref:Uncharacterized protein n=1 Tax=Hebeloma cylindrosporum TaxID=76867 RepID=A0A0C3C261_HEBCY|nr:hypothetical protein M413DRAFT_245237 [Hebeloma cylindrosporum h7]